MATQVTILIQDDEDTRKEIDALCETAPDEVLAKWAVKIAQRVLTFTGIDYQNNPVLSEGFQMAEGYWHNRASLQDVREAAFKIHSLSRYAGDEDKKNAMRVAGQAVTTSYMKAHAIITSGYAIKVVNLRKPGENRCVQEERLKQKEELQALIHA